MTERPSLRYKRESTNSGVTGKNSENRVFSQVRLLLLNYKVWRAVVPGSVTLQEYLRKYKSRIGPRGTTHMLLFLCGTTGRNRARKPVTPSPRRARPVFPKVPQSPIGSGLWMRLFRSQLGVGRWWVPQWVKIVESLILPRSLRDLNARFQAPPNV